jgi:NAD(P)-dependent dehydrogenase (short-subunit alcohol dehydrogenase family)
MSIAIVTGGVRGIGLAISHTLLADGIVDQVIALDRDIDGLDPSPGVEPVRCDVTDEDAVRTAVGTRRGVTVLVNNAGGGDPISAARTDPTPFDPFGPVDLWRRMIDINLTSAHIVTRVVGPNLPRGAAICNTASIAGLMPGGLYAYGAAKAALIHWSRSMALALAPRGIRVNAVAPGLIFTRIWGESVSRELFEQMVGQMVPLGTEQLPQDIADTVAFLCSSRAGQITGQVVAVDGGATLRSGVSR